MKEMEDCILFKKISKFKRVLSIVERIKAQSQYECDHQQPGRRKRPDDCSAGRNEIFITEKFVVF